VARNRKGVCPGRGGVEGSGAEDEAAPREGERPGHFAVNEPGPDRVERGFEEEQRYETEAEAEAAAVEARHTLGPCGVVPISRKVGLITVTRFYVVPLEEE